MKVIIANWKMFGTLEFLREYFALIDTHRDQLSNNVRFVICLPFVFLQNAINFVQEYQLQSVVSIAAQDISDSTKIATTGGISASILSDIGVKWTMIGHSETRNTSNASDNTIANKLKNALSCNMNIIYCTGESFDHESIEDSIIEIKDQILNDFHDISVSKLNDIEIIIAYEPKWSIGSNAIPEASTINKVINAIRDLSEQIFKIKVKYILYGGSVNIDNANDLLSIEDLDGLLMGRQSLNIIETIKILDLAKQYDKSII